MELAYSPNAAITEKKYRHYTVTSFADRDLFAARKKEFFYIGKDSFIIDTLIQAFESGYAAENVEKAISILTKVIEKRNIYPDVILIDATVGVSALNAFHKFIYSKPSLACIPLLVESSAAGARELNEFRKLPFVDEIISMHQQPDKLLSKIYFIKKIKDAGNIKRLEENITQSENTNAGVKDFFKRCFDVFIASVILLALSPLFLLIALAIRIESRESVFYVSKRAGRGYRVFNFYKFRTMEMDADTKVDELSYLNQYNPRRENGPLFYKLNNDPRVTRIGAFLRNTSLDELPQLLNVLTGDMSLVGNRPLPLYEAETLTTDDCAARFMAPAGITGLWQVTKRNQDGVSAEERVSLDIAYARKYNFMYDLWIMANTPSALIQKSGE